MQEKNDTERFKNIDPRFEGLNINFRIFITDSHTIVNKIAAKFYKRQKSAVLLYICHIVFIAIAGAAGTKSTVYADIGWVPADIGRTLGRDTGACACLETSGGFTKR